MHQPLPLPAAELRAAVAQRYGRVATCPETPAGFPVGRAFAEAVGYPAELLDTLPAAASASFAGVAALPRWLALAAGMTVVDLGCGAGLDTLIAARQVGPAGRVIGIDASTDMAQLARRNAEAVAATNVTILTAPVEETPLEDGLADAIIANGIVNLSPEKERLVGEIARLLKPGGALTAAEIVLREEIPLSERATLEDWFR